MKVVRYIGLCLTAAFALGAGVASSASAGELLAQIAGGGSVAGVTFLSSAGLAQLIRHNGEEIHCKDVTNHGKFLSATLGDILIRFLGCGASGLSCNTAGAGAGEIHLPLATTLFHLGLAHLVLATSTDRVPAAVVLPAPVKMECGGGLAKIEVRGNVIGALQTAAGAPQPLNTAFSAVNLNFQQTSAGLQHLTLILMPGSTAPTEYFLETNKNGGAFERASEVVNDTLDGFTTSGGAATNIELVEP